MLWWDWLTWMVILGIGNPSVWHGPKPTTSLFPVVDEALVMNLSGRRWWAGTGFPGVGHPGWWIGGYPHPWCIAHAIVTKATVPCTVVCWQLPTWKQTEPQIEFFWLISPRKLNNDKGGEWVAFLLLWHPCTLCANTASARKLVVLLYLLHMRLLWNFARGVQF